MKREIRALLEAYLQVKNKMDDQSDEQHYTEEDINSNKIQQMQ